jgi:hypothetical protein
MKLNKFHLRRFIASLLLTPIVVGLHLTVWLALTMLGAEGNYELSLNALPSLVVVWILVVTFWTEFYSFAMRMSGGDE